MMAAMFPKRALRQGNEAEQKPLESAVQIVYNEANKTVRSQNDD